MSLQPYPGNKITYQPHRFWPYPVKSAVPGTHPTYDAELLPPLDHQTEDTPYRLVGQIGEVGRGDSWEAVGAPPQGASM